MTQKAPYPLSALRALAIHAQALDQSIPDSSQASIEKIAALAQMLGCIQIDTLQMVSRSQQLVLWSRLGDYDRQDFEELIYGEDRLLFEGWMHAASILPISEYRYQMPRHRRYREKVVTPFLGTDLSHPSKETVVEQVLKKIRETGAVRTADFEGDGKPRGGWWDWKPAKEALEFLLARGDLMVEKRVNFQRYYNLRDRVLPPWVEVTEPTEMERDRFWLERGVRAFGICQPEQACDYAYLKRGESKRVIQDFIHSDLLVPVQGILFDGTEATMVVHAKDISLLDRAASGDIVPWRTTFLSPFDSLFWPKRRDMQLWGFFQTLECYVPEAKRRWGYFSLPILYRDRLVGRFDPKLERSKRLLRIKVIHLEPGVVAEDEMVAEIAAAMRAFMKFHQASDLVIERCNPEEFGGLLLNAM